VNRSLALAAVFVGCAASQATAPAPVAPPSEPAEPIASGTVAPPTKQYSPGLEVVDTKLGTGAECKAGDRISVRYRGTLDDGSEFDSNAKATFQIGVGMLIKGWDEGIPGMRVGGVRQLTVPPSLGYGSKAMGKIPAYSTLHFEVELLEINP
jgi:FKBP-type peptidyl-prolyl cis-trans isomerase